MRFALGDRVCVTAALYDIEEGRIFIGRVGRVVDLKTLTPWRFEANSPYDYSVLLDESSDAEKEEVWLADGELEFEAEPLDPVMEELLNAVR